MLELDLLKRQSLNAYAEHLIRHIEASGLRDNLIYTPCEEAPKREEIIKIHGKMLETTPGEPCWGRTWIIRQDNHIIGHLDLEGFHLSSGCHRANLSMGLEENYRGQGLAKKLMQTALAWAKQQDFIDWVDLGVFAHNQPALNLYKSYGFTEIGRKIDLFRVNGQKIDDILMTLKIN